MRGVFEGSGLFNVKEGATVQVAVPNEPHRLRFLFLLFSMLPTPLGIAYKFCPNIEVCCRAGEPTKFKFCKRCDGAFLCYCMWPPHKWFLGYNLLRCLWQIVHQR